MKRTPEEQAAYAKRAAARAEIIPPRSASRGGNPGTGDGRTRRRSSRFYLAKAEDYLRAADAGLIGSADAARRVGMVKSISEIFLAHKVLEMQGQAEPSDVTPLPEEGYTPPMIRAHRVKKVAVKRGTGRHGEPIDEKTVTIESNHAEDDPEPDAELEVLT